MVICGMIGAGSASSTILAPDGKAVEFAANTKIDQFISEHCSLQIPCRIHGRVKTHKLGHMSFTSVRSAKKMPAGCNAAQQALQGSTSPPAAGTRP